MTDLVTPPGLLADERVLRAIELIWREAALLDHKAYHDWEALYAEDGIYVIPIDTSTDDFANTLNMVYDNRAMRAMRVTRMTEGYALAAVDAATTVRTVSRFVPMDSSDDLVSLAASQVLIAYKRGRHDVWAADVEFAVRLGDTSAEDRIVRKVIRLVNAEDAVPAAGFLP